MGSSGFVLLMAGVGFSLTSQHPTRVPIRASAPAVLDDEDGHSHSQPKLAAVKLVPDAVYSESGRESVQYHAEITVNRGTDVGLAWELEIVDDHGKLVESKLATGKTKAVVKQTVSTPAILAKLADGFYALRARVAVSARNQPPDIIETEQFVQVVDGLWMELSDVEWLKLSRATLAYSAAEIAGGEQ